MAGTLLAAYWLYSYRVTRVLEYIDRSGREFHTPERIAESPWWSVYAVIVVLLAGAAGVAWLLPEWRRRIRRATYFANRA